MIGRAVARGVPPSALIDRLRRVGKGLCRAAMAVGIVALFAGAVAALERTCPPVALAPTSGQIDGALRQARDRGAMWTIEKDGRQSWLYGTIHIGSLLISVPGPTVTHALRAADIIAIEIDLSDPNPVKAITAPVEPPVPIPAMLLERAKEQARKACVAWDAVAKLPPILLGATLTVLDGRWVNLDTAYASELIFVGMARSTGKRLRTLESAAAQRAVFVSPPPERQIEALDAAITALEQNHVRQPLSKLAQAWSDGDLATLAAYDQWCECMAGPGDKAEFARLVAGRNPALASAIDRLHREGQVSAAAGILHMVGDRGLPALLEGLGYTVTRVRFDARSTMRVDSIAGLRAPQPPAEYVIR